MKSIEYLRKTFIITALCFSLGVSAESVVIEDDEGNSFLFDVEPENSFLDVIDCLPSSRFSTNSEEEFKVFKVMFAKHSFPSEKLAKKVRTLPRNYASGISTEEAKDIAFILKTMANSSLPRIKGAETSLKQAGDRIDGVHPFFFLSCIFTNEELKVCIRNLQGRTFVWRGFLDGITGSLAEENSKNNLIQFTVDFATRIRVDPNAILPLLMAEQWEKFVDLLIAIVPREGETKRYNM